MEPLRMEWDIRLAEFKFWAWPVLSRQRRMPK